MGEKNLQESIMKIVLMLVSQEPYLLMLIATNQIIAIERLNFKREVHNYPAENQVKVKNLI